MLASLPYLQEREVSADRPRVSHSIRENSVSTSQCPHTKECRVKKHFPTEGISSGHQSVQGKDELVLRFSEQEEAARTVLEEQRDHQLAEAKSETLKQECKVDALNTCIRSFQRQAHSRRLELDSLICV